MQRIESWLPVLTKKLLQDLMTNVLLHAVESHY